ncbi:MAG: hypothetical protein B9S38_00155 [Verrucomicrobiia bacterium Tous-C4TDCM]|nr:MAG: hypothetical protein B9S38_00155 [Verrucomicrobiae bacterium Tous-C4TDCM]
MFNPFSKRRPITLDKYCNAMLRDQIISPEFQGNDLGRVYTEVVVKNIGEQDPSFLSVDQDALHEQLLAARIEIFGIAWVHEFGFDLAGDQTEWTLDYLKGARRETLWEDGEAYNQAAARSSLIHDPRSAKGQSFSQELDRKRLTQFGKYSNAGLDEKAAARVCNRMSTEKSWKIGLTPAYLMLSLCDKLGIQPSEKVQESLIFIIRGFYDGIRSDMKTVKILPEAF